MQQTLFTVGPVEMFPDSLAIAGQPLPYFRTAEFSRSVLACERDLCTLAGAPEGSRAILLTASGSGGMEAALINSVGAGDRVLIIVGGGFGERFCEICAEVGIDYDTVTLEPGRALAADVIAGLDLRPYKALLVNAHETTTGLRYDLQRLGDACRRNGTLFLVDAISAFLCDPIDMTAMGIDLLLTSSQKALALAPGLSLLLLGPRALEAAAGRQVRSYYFAFRRYLLDGERGQTPFTPAVGVILQLEKRLELLRGIGIEALVRSRAELAGHFRQAIAGLPYALFPETPSNALTALSPTFGVSAQALCTELKSRYGMVVNPNGGKLKDRVFRVGHMGNLQISDLTALAQALKELSQ
jgi:aspartate aminotransferase-like enzyme